MPYRKITDPQAIISAINECDDLGRDNFLEKYGYRRAREYFLKFSGRLYDSKAILGVAHKYQFPEDNALDPQDFGGGEQTVEKWLEKLGFNVVRLPSLSSYVVLAENDESAWNDETGERYHFPARYQKFLRPGTRAVYYKGKLKSREFKDKRLSPEPHYFGIAIIGKSEPDPESSKGDYFCEILDFTPFSTAALAKQPNGFVEKIPQSRETNYWRDGVRSIDETTFKNILALSDLDQENHLDSHLSDLSQGLPESLESLQEGKRVSVHGSRYERKPKIRQQALVIHGYSCQACGFNFEEYYGAHGLGFIHVHHLKPLSEVNKEHAPDPRNDFAALCANCHAMVHREKNRTLSMDELKKLIADTRSKR